MSLTHGMTVGGRTAEYRAWEHMKSRCYDPHVAMYPRYGGRGITVCERWRASFPAFLEDMGKRPSYGHSLDRINNDGDYEPGNCRWSTAKEQGRNTARNIFVVYRGARMSLCDACDAAGVSRKAVGNRIFRNKKLPQVAFEMVVGQTEAP